MAGHDRYTAQSRQHVGDREELLQGMVDDWLAVVANGEAVMQASNWRDVLDLNERVGDRLVAAALVERDGLDARRGDRGRRPVTCCAMRSRSASSTAHCALCTVTPGGPPCLQPSAGVRPDRAHRSGEVRKAPPGEGIQRGAESPALLREAVLHPGWMLAVGHALDQAVPLETP